MAISIMFCFEITHRRSSNKIHPFPNIRVYWLLFISVIIFDGATERKVGINADGGRSTAKASLCN